MKGAPCLLSIIPMFKSSINARTTTGGTGRFGAESTALIWRLILRICGFKVPRGTSKSTHDAVFGLARLLISVTLLTSTITPDLRRNRHEITNTDCPSLPSRRWEEVGSRDQPRVSVSAERGALYCPNTNHRPWIAAQSSRGTIDITSKGLPFRQCPSLSKTPLPFTVPSLPAR